MVESPISAVCRAVRVACCVLAVSLAWPGAASSAWADDGADEPPVQSPSRWLADVDAARDRARRANADRLFAERWQRAERQRDALESLLRSGDTDRVSRDAGDAIETYRALELEALAAALFSRARAEIAQARADRVQRHAPRTLERAAELLASAEAALAENRNDLDLPRSLADEAAYTARHASYLAGRVQAASRRGGSIEDVLLDYEEPLRRASAEAGLLPRFDNGPAAVGDQLVDRIHELEDALRRSRNALEDSNQRVQNLQEELRDLDAEMGGIVRERSELIQRVEAQERVRRQFESLDALFSRDEAMVLREGNRVTIRLVGLNFETGGHDVSADAEPLLEKLSRVTNLFPRARLRIEGHTDSRGSEALNQRLSERRAEAVRDRLVDRFGIPATRLTAEGLGEDRPIASNETPEGRERNRRIDVTFTVDD